MVPFHQIPFNLLFTYVVVGRTCGAFDKWKGFHEDVIQSKGQGVDFFCCKVRTHHGCHTSDPIFVYSRVTKVLAP